MSSQQPKPVNWRAWILAGVAVLVLVVILQNSQEVSVEVLFASFNAPLIVVLLVAVGVGGLLGYAAPILLRHRREQRRHGKAIEAKSTPKN